MIKRLGWHLLVIGASIVGSAQAAAAQQTLNFSLGGFVVRGEDARVDDDVLIENRRLLVFDIDEFNGPTVGGEWLVPIADYFEAGAGVSYSRRTVPSVYEDFFENDGTEIEQDLRLRIVPIAFTVRVLPLGQSSPVQPYFGVGLGLFNWRYSETGEFIDTDGIVFDERFVADGTQAGPIALGGIRFAGDTFTAGGEIRYHRAEADLDDDEFLGSKLDLGGWSYLFTFGFRFR